MERDSRREGLLSDDFRHQIEHLNQFLPEEHAIQYISFDMARCKKKRGDEVMTKLTEIAAQAVKRTGIYYSGSPTTGLTTNTQLCSVCFLLSRKSALKCVFCKVTI